MVSARALNIREPTLASVGPVRDETPAIAGDGPSFVALDDDLRLVRRSDVEVLAGVVGQRLRAEDLGEIGGRPFLGEPSAHRGRSLWDGARRRQAPARAASSGSPRPRSCTVAT